MGEALEQLARDGIRTFVLAERRCDWGGTAGRLPLAELDALTDGSGL